MTDEYSRWLDPNMDGFDPQLGNKLMTQAGIAKFLNIKYESHGDDWVELRVDWRPELAGNDEAGTLATGAITCVLDNATSLSAWQRNGGFRPQVTMDLRLDHLRPSPANAPLYGRGICYHISGGIAFVRAIAHNGDIDDPLAYASGSFVYVDGPV